LAQIARPVIAIIRDVLVGRVFDEGWKRHQDGPDGHSAISKCADAPQSGQRYHDDSHGETISPTRGRGIVVISISFISFANLDRLNVVAVEIIGRVEPGRPLLGARQKSIADYGGGATPEANRRAQCGKSACCVRRGGGWKRGMVEMM
jgi:hypothetical protein